MPYPEKKVHNADVAKQVWSLLWWLSMIEIKGKKAATLLSRWHFTF